MKTLLIILIILTGCSANIPRNPKPIHTAKFMSTFSHYVDMYSEPVQTQDKVNYGPNTVVAMSYVLGHIDEFFEQLNEDFAGEQPAYRTFWLNEYAVNLMTINDEYRNAIDWMRVETPERLVELKEVHYRTLPYAKRFKLLWLPSGPDVIPYFETILQQIIYISDVARRVV